MPGLPGRPGEKGEKGFMGPRGVPGDAKEGTPGPQGMPGIIFNQGQVKVEGGGGENPPSNINWENMPPPNFIHLFNCKSDLYIFKI